MGDACDGWHRLASDDLSVIEERMPPGTAEQRHLHQHARQFFLVLEGEATLDGLSRVLRRGQGLHVPPGAPHQMRKDSGADIRFLVVSAPKRRGDRVSSPLH